jgi:hypothetical protein
MLVFWDASEAGGKLIYVGFEVLTAVVLSSNAM